MTRVLKFRRGTTAEHAVFAGAEGEVTVNTDKDCLVVHDALTVGGIEHVNLNSIQKLTNKDISATHLTVSGVSTFTGAIEATGDLDVDGHTELDNVNISGILTATSAFFNGNVSIGGTLTYEDVTNIDAIGLITARSGVRIISGGLEVSGITTLGVTTTTNLTTQNIYISGISTFSGDIDVSGHAELDELNVSGISTFAGIATVTGSTLFAKQLNVSGISTLGNTIVGGATTELIVNGDARITGILTVGTSSISFNGANNSVTIGAGVTIYGNTGIISATQFRGNGANLTSIDASNLGSGTIPDARFPATLPAISGANLTGIFASGTLMLFQQTAAPTGWTKQTTHNNKALRVVTGTASSGGSTAFTSVFASRTPAGSVSVSGTNSSGSVSATTLTEAQIPSHTHTLNNGTAVRRNVPGANFAGGGDGYGEPYTLSNANAGSSNSHTHGFTNPSWSGSGSFTGTAMDFAVQYVDLIIASKN